MMKKNKLLILFIVLAMTFLLVSCDNTEPAPSATQKAAEDKTETKEEVNETSPIEFNIAVRQEAGQPEWDELSFYVKYNENYPEYSVSFDEIPDATATETLNLMLASGETLPDAFIDLPITAYDVATYGTMGIFVPLDDYINAEIMPNLTNVYDQRPNYKSLVTVADGHIYSCPWIEEMGITHVRTILNVNQTWLDTLGIEAPKTTLEFEDMLKMFKSEDLNGNGDASDEIPFSFVYANQGWDRAMGINYMFGAFGMPDNIDHTAVVDNKVVFTAGTQEFKNAVKWFNSLYEQGLIDQESFSQDSAQLAAKGKTEFTTIGCFPAWRDFQVLGAERAQEYSPMYPLTGPDGDQLWGRESNYSEMGKYKFVMSNDCENPEDMMKWVDGLYDPLTSIENNWGTFDVVMKQTEDGLWYKALDEVPADLTSGEWTKINTARGPVAILGDYFGTLTKMEQGGAQRLEIVKEYYNPYLLEQFLPDVNYSVEDTERLNTLKNDIIPYVDEMVAKWITSGGIDEEWDNYLSMLEKAGVEEWIEIQQKGYEAFIN